MTDKYDVVIGLEVHIQMNTLSKAFCGDENTFGADPNTQISAISLAHPGTLPVANKDHIIKAIQLGLGLNCRINQTNFFDRKHYFYPDSPKNYQITQDKVPICIGGNLSISIANYKKSVQIHHIHMEDDAGKTIHDQHESCSLIDLNRAGTPLLELVTEPDLCSGDEVYEFIAELQKLLRYLGVSDGDMEKGSMRCDCNVSIRPKGSTVLGTRCEIKNLNSKKFAKEAVTYEAHRQMLLLENGQSFSQQTLHYNTSTGQTEMLRSKEGAEDYRYFPDPDLPMIIISDEELKSIKEQMPQLPWEVKQQLITTYSFTADYAEQLSQSPEHVELFSDLATHSGDPQGSANFIINNLLPTLQQDNKRLSENPISIADCQSFIGLIKDGRISASVANQRLWPRVWEEKKSPQILAEEMELLISNNQDFLDEVIEKVLSENQGQLDQYRKGKKALFGFFMGAVMRNSKETPDPAILKSKLTKALEA